MIRLNPEKIVSSNGGDRIHGFEMATATDKESHHNDKAIKRLSNYQIGTIDVIVSISGSNSNGKLPNTSAWKIKNHFSSDSYNIDKNIKLSEESEPKYLIG